MEISAAFLKCGNKTDQPLKPAYAVLCAFMFQADLKNAALERVQIGTGETANLPYSQETFDLITFTNALHDMPEPVGTLAGLRRLLAQEKQLVVEDFARREHPFAWAVIEWLARQIEGTYVHAYTLAEAQSLCQQAGLHVAYGRSFTADRLWHGWVLCAYGIASVSG